MTATNDFRGRFAEAPEHGSGTMRVLVRSSRTKHNYYLRTRQCTGTGVSIGRGARLGLNPLIPRLITRQQVVQSPARGAHPFYADVQGPPLVLEAVPVPVIDWPKVQGSAVSEVKPGPQIHHGRVEETSK